MTTIARITHPDRLRDWQAVFGTDTIPLLSFVGHYATLPGHDQPQLVYGADLSQLTPDQRQLLIIHIATRFGYTPEYVAANLDAVGLPILAADVVVVSDGIGLSPDAMNDDEYENLIVRRTCDYCGGEFRAGITSCTCDDRSWRDVTAADLEDEE